MVFHEGLVAYSDLAFLFLRLSLGSLFLYHGLPKIKGFRAMAKGMNFNPWFVLLLGLVEVASALSVILGVYPSLGALGIVLVMLGAMHLKIFKWKIPFGVSEKPGWGGDLIILASAVVLCVSTYGYTII